MVDAQAGGFEDAATLPTPSKSAHRRPRVRRVRPRRRGERQLGFHLGFFGKAARRGRRCCCAPPRSGTTGATASGDLAAVADEELVVVDQVASALAPR